MKKIVTLKKLIAAIAFITCISAFTTATGATVTVTAPNGGETLTAGTSATITWTSDVTGNLRIALLKNGVQYSLIAGGTVNDGSHTWLVPQGILSGTDYTVKISSCTDPLVTDVSDASFTIAGGAGSSVIVTAPNGGETFTAGTSATVTWSSDIAGNVRITLLKNGLHYALISSSTPNDGTHPWLIPAGLAPGTEYAVKVASATNFLLFDVSDAYFSIIAGGGTTMTVTAPNGGETFTAGTSTTITYTSDITGNIRIVLLKGGIQYSVIAGCLSNTGSFNWLIPATVISGTDYTVKISSCINPLLTDVSDANFTVVGVGGSTVTVTAPNGGETLTAGTTTNITWTSDIVGNVRITLLKAGLHFALISYGTPNDGTHTWALPAGMVPGTEYSIKVASAATPLLYDVSDANFSVVAGGGTNVTVTAPNGGESFIAGTPVIITWTSDITGYLRISLLKGGAEYALIANKTANDGNHTWLIPQGIPNGSDYTVKICYCVNPTLFDVSDAAFTVEGGAGSVVTVLSPNGGESLVAGTTSAITWTSDVVGDVRIILLKGGLHYGLISYATANDGTFDWVIPAGIAPSSDYTVKIASVANLFIFDVSDASFSIVSSAGSSYNVSQNPEFKNSDLEQTNSAPVISMFPNPAVDVINIVADQTIEHVWVMDNLGQILIDVKPNSGQIGLDVNSFQPGFYFVKTEINGTVSTERVIIK